MKKNAKNAQSNVDLAEIVGDLSPEELSMAISLARLPSENPNPLMRINHEGKLLYANPAAHAMNGLILGGKQKRPPAKLRDAAVSCYANSTFCSVDFEVEGQILSFSLSPIVAQNYINLFGRDVTEERQAEIQARDLARFPSENPNPVMRCDAMGIVLFANHAAHALQGLIEDGVGSRTTRVVALAVQEAAREKTNRAVEYKLGEKVYSFAIAYIEESGWLNLYGREITAELKAKEALLAAKSTLEERVRERTASVRLLQNILIAANQAASIEEALQTALHEVCVYAAWPLGHAYLVGEDDDEMVPTGIWHLDRQERFTDQLTEEAIERFGDEDDLPGQVLQRRQFVWITDIVNSDRFGRKAFAQKMGFNTAIAFPVTVGEEVVGVLEFFTEQLAEPEADTMTAMGHIGTELGSIVLRKRQERALRKSERRMNRSRTRLQDAIEAISDGFALYGPDDVLLLANSKYRDLLYPGMQHLVATGMTFEEILREACDRGLIDNAAENPEAWIQKRIHQHQNPTGEASFQRRSSGIWLKITEHRTQEGGVVAIYSDVTELKMREEELNVMVEQVGAARDEALRANSTKSQFLASMSHELRTPLNAIIGYSELLLDDAEDLGQDDFIPDLQKIQGSGKHLLALINDILDLSKVEAGKVELFFEQFQVTDMISLVESTITPIAEKAGINLEIKCPSNIGSMRSDLTKVRQSLLNLMSNACKFTREGSVTLTVKKGRRKGQDELVFAVRDEGIGMTPAQMERVFDPFTQADASTTKDFGGTGLGLPITKEFCELLGGEISCESVYGKGSTFTIRLPVDSEKLVAERQAEEEDLSELEGDGPLVLIVDDQKEARELVARHLTRSGYRVAQAKDAEEGLRMAAELQPCAITLDVIMPKTDGWSMLGKLKTDENLRDIPVIMLSVEDKKNVGYSLGASDYLTKPVNKKQLIEALQRQCPGKSDMTVLVVEDDEKVRGVVRRSLDQAGHKVVEAENGNVALQRLESIVPDLVLLDLMMPEMDGFEFLQHFRAKQNFRKIPVVVVTSKNLTKKERATLSGSVQSLVEKSNVQLDELVDDLHSLIESLPKDVTSS